MCQKLFRLAPIIFVFLMLTVTSAAIPPGWSSRDIGTTGGRASESNGRWTLTGDGYDIWNNSDAFHYAYIPLSGDGEIIARVVDNGTGSNAWAKGGLMIRETLSPTSKYAMMIVTGGEGGGKAFQCRPSTGGNCFNSHGGWEVYPPLWIMLKRSGNVFTAYYSHNSINWMQQPNGTSGDATTNPRTIPMAKDVFIGLCVTSHAYGEWRTFTFDNVTVGGFPLTASNPSPPDGALHPDPWATLQWSAGVNAVSHDVYFGDSLEQVEAGTGGTFRGNQRLTYFDVGLPGCPCPEGLVPEMAYYWRIDEVDMNGRAHKGNVWSFTTVSQAAYEPSPPDNARFVDRNVVLSWRAGFNAMRHEVYFGDNFDDVKDGLGDTFQGNQSPTFFRVGLLYPDGLIPGATYYWRIDEVEANGMTVHEGAVWSFSATFPELGTILQEKWNNIYGDAVDALKTHWKYPDSPDETKVIAQFDTGTNLGENYGGRIHGWLYAPLTGNYTFWISTDDQGELWLSTDDRPRNGKLIAYVKDSPTASTGWVPYNTWTKYASQESDPIRLVAGDKYYIMALWKEGIVDDHCQVAWEGPGIPERTIIPGDYLSIDPVGTYPIPADGAQIGDRTPLLQWNPREAGVKYDVYFGTDFNRVKNANRTDTSGIYRGQWTEANYATERLDIGRTYYWRVDDVEVDGKTIHQGNVWSFTVVDTITVEYQVSSSEDDGYASNKSLQNLNSDYLKVGPCGFAQPPYYVSGMVFRNVEIPQSAKIISAHLKIRSYNNHLTGLVYAKIEAEAADHAEPFSGLRHIGTLPRTNASVDWNHYEPWLEDTWYNSPNIADVIQELVNRSGWSPVNGSLAILYSTQEREGGYRNISSYDRSSNSAPRLEITYAP